MSAPRPPFYKRAFLKVLPERGKLAVYDLEHRLLSQRWPTLWFFYALLWLRRAGSSGFRVENVSGTEKIDLVILTVSKDQALLARVLEGLRKNIAHPLNKIFVVSREEAEIIDFCRGNKLVFISERDVLGYGKEDTPYTAQGVDRSGWMFQQLLKLSGGKFVEMKRYAIVDSDTILIRSHVFTKDEKLIFLESTEWNEPYFESFWQIFGEEAPTRLSLTSHMMIFDVERLAEMKTEIEQRHSKPWDHVYRETARPETMSCISDYETFGNWMLLRHPEQVTTTPLYNTSLSRKKLADLSTLMEQYGTRFKSLSFHAYIDTLETFPAAPCRPENSR